MQITSTPYFNNSKNKNSTASFKMAAKMTSDIDILGDNFVSALKKTICDPKLQKIFKNTDVKFCYGIDPGLLTLPEEARFLRIIMTPHRKNGGNYFTRTFDLLRGRYQTETTKDPKEINSTIKSLYKKLKLTVKDINFTQ